MQTSDCISNARPFYRQIVDQIAADIISCKLRPGQQLQPIRQLSTQYHANPNTVQRAVDELKRERLLTKRRQGLFVTPDSNLIFRFRQQQCDKLVKTFSWEMEKLGYTAAEVRQMLQQMQ